MGYSSYRTARILTHEVQEFQKSQLETEIKDST